MGNLVESRKESFSQVFFCDQLQFLECFSQFRFCGENWDHRVRCAVCVYTERTYTTHLTLWLGLKTRSYVMYVEKADTTRWTRWTPEKAKILRFGHLYSRLSWRIKATWKILVVCVWMIHHFTKIHSGFLSLIWWRFHPFTGSNQKSSVSLYRL